MSIALLALPLGLNRIFCINFREFFKLVSLKFCFLKLYPNRSINSSTVFEFTVVLFHFSSNIIIYIVLTRFNSMSFNSAWHKGFNSLRMKFGLTQQLKLE